MLVRESKYRVRTIMHSLSLLYSACIYSLFICFIQHSKHNFKYKHCNLQTRSCVIMSHRFMTRFFVNINLPNNEKIIAVLYLMRDLRQKSLRFQVKSVAKIENVLLRFYYLILCYWPVFQTIIVFDSHSILLLVCKYKYIVYFY